MKKLSLKILIGVISLALLGLVGVQIYWINNAITLRREQFSRSVNKVLYNVSVKMERIEAINQLKDQQQNRQAFMQKLQQLMQMDDGNSGNYQDSLSDANFSVDSSNDGYNRYQYQRRDSNGYFSFSFSVKKGDSNFFPRAEGNKVILENNHLAFKKKQFIKNIIATLSDMSYFHNIRERIDKNLLDSLLKTELKNEGISTTYHYTVFNMAGNSIYKIPKSDINQYRSKSYNVHLFPNDILSQPSFLSVIFPNQKRYLLKTMWVMLSSSGLFLIIIIAAFSFTIITILRQKKLSIIKNDFVGNMTHELKTPIATISLAAEALSDPVMGNNPKIKSNYLSIIREENKRLSMMVENVLKSAMWDKQDFTLQLEKVNINEILETVAGNLIPQVKNKNGEIKLALDAENPIVTGDKTHITNITYNLMDNAIKYTPDNLKLNITSRDTEDGIVFCVEDNGIGISKENQKKIFDKFYRIPTGNVHDVKGFGLGLNYVKAIVEKHQGEIKIKGELGKGTKFSIFLPNKLKNK